MRRLGLAVAAAALVALPAAGEVSAGEPALTVNDTASSYTVSNASVSVSVAKSPWRLSLQRSGTTAVQEQDPLLPDVQTNPHYTTDRDLSGSVDRAYPGLPTVSQLPLAYYRDGLWQHVTALLSASTTGTTVSMVVATSDGSGGSVTLRFRGTTVDLDFRPAGAASTGVAESFVSSPIEHYYGGGQRFEKVDLRGLSVPLWASHGVGADRYTYTNEGAIPYLSSTGGWALAERTGARAELDVAAEPRPGTVTLVAENDVLQISLYAGTLQQNLSAYTADTGRNPVPPTWALRPMWWDDARNSDAEITSDLAALKAADIPVSAYWIDNPWEQTHGDFTPAATRFPDFPEFLARLHAQGVRVVTWVSPFVRPGSTVAKAGGQTVGNLPADNNDQTYYPVRSLEAHADLSDPTTYDAEVDAAAALIASGVDGFKLDRGEEDLGDQSTAADGSPNRLRHSRYVLSYDQAMRAACQRSRPNGDCFLIARGAVGGTPGSVGNWAGDSLVSEGQPGIGAALHGMLAMALSGQPVYGSDVGGYSGRVDGSNPSAGLFTRWAQLGAVSPVFESPNHPFSYDAQTVAAIRKAAIVKDRLGDYTHRAAQQAHDDGTPIVRPLVLAYPSDPAAPAIEDEYLYGPDLLTAPLTTGVEQEGPATRDVYFPAGGWTNVFTGEHVTGPLTLPVVSAYDEWPLYLRDGAALPMRTFADLDTVAPPPDVPEVPTPAMLPLVGLALLALVVVVRRRRSPTT